MSVFFFGISVALWEKRNVVNKRDRVFLLGVGCLLFLFVLKDSFDLRKIYFPDVSPALVWCTTFTVAVCVVLPFIFNRKSIVFLLPLMAFSFASTAFVNPIMKGVGVFEKSEIVTAINSASLLDNNLWASDQLNYDAVLLASPVPKLSGQSGSGPNLSAWYFLDPAKMDEKHWNRGSAYISFSWTDEAEERIYNPSPDMIKIAISPCSKKLAELNLGWIISSQTLLNPCLSKFSTIKFLGENVNIYQVSESE